MTGLPHRALDALSPPEYLVVPEHYLRRRQCVHCGQDFCEYENLGQLRCRLHPGLAQYDARRRDFFYSCCRDSVESRGCVEADHLDEMPSLANQQERWAQLRAWSTLAVPVLLFRYGLVPPASPSQIWMRAQRQSERTQRLVLPFGDQQVVLQVRPIGEQLARQAAESPTLVRLLTEGDARVQRRDDTMRELDGSNWRQARAQNQPQGAEEVRAPSVFIPFVVIGRLKL